MPDRPRRPFGFWAWIDWARRDIGLRNIARRGEPATVPPAATVRPEAVASPPPPYQPSDTPPTSDLLDDCVQGAAWFIVAIVAVWQGTMVVLGTGSASTADPAAAVVQTATAMRAVALIVAAGAVAYAVRYSFAVRAVVGAVGIFVVVGMVLMLVAGK
jgi:hypothetical protein